MVISCLFVSLSFHCSSETLRSRMDDNHVRALGPIWQHNAQQWCPVAPSHSHCDKGGVGGFGDTTRRRVCLRVSRTGLLALAFLSPYCNTFNLIDAATVAVAAVHVTSETRSSRGKRSPTNPMY
ncbi:hypothetical protein BDB00DRAFT_822273 [Zychaea mexicana]|uniref:uncharacterized protein n=1 Tax=Zychaea mexicana TaxID=64656 RepID=UPI0022FEFB0B|nr:uncharacterized protein BDB00DRAFT_856329 [Zychaea mexicana]XP_052979992.1 uncharacterized protein BDB00DRAFT_822273 [Zychaea mexicana]KAI9484341.1 hypothetical protein BDB00DRAFT_856329 [Zychaea mexicana]KAI9493727.1 hypothetical protein BDB00DRAFT_822273 [Zychaea mexicana]